MKNQFDKDNLSKLNAFMQQNHSINDSQRLSQFSRSNSESSQVSSELNSNGSERNQQDQVDNLINSNLDKTVNFQLSDYDYFIEELKDSLTKLTSNQSNDNVDNELKEQQEIYQTLCQLDDFQSEIEINYIKTYQNLILKKPQQDVLINNLCNLDNVD